MLKPFLQSCKEIVHLGKLMVSANRRFIRIPPGHFYSPLPNIKDIRANKQSLFDSSANEIPGVDIRAEEQAENLEATLKSAAAMDFPIDASENKRYYYNNTYFRYFDATILYGMLVRHRPARVVEIGSGFSSALMLDCRDDIEGYEPQLTFVEPFPDRLKSLFRDDDDELNLVQEFVQNTAMSTYDQLEAGDFLFIDTSHVSKIGSDVNHLFFEVLPRLKPGVFVHVHDVMWPFEYTEHWVESGRAWNEAYLLRALLIGNEGLKIHLHLAYAENHLNELIKEHLPKNVSTAQRDGIPNGTGIWMQTC